MYNAFASSDAFIGKDIPVSSANINGTGFMMGRRNKYTARTGMAVISTANANLDGTGTLGTVLTADSAKKGAIITRIIVKAQGNTTQGMVRLFVVSSNGLEIAIIDEIEVPAITRDGTNAGFIYVNETLLYLKAGRSLKASTEKGETFIVSADAMDWDVS